VSEKKPDVAGAAMRSCTNTIIEKDRRWRLDSSREQQGERAGAAPLHDVDHALHARLARAGRRRARGVELATEMLGKAGFGDVKMTRLPHDIVNAYFVARR